MNKFVIATLSFTAGLIAGFGVAQIVEIEKDDKIKENSRVWANDIKKPEETKVVTTDPAELESPKDDDPTEFISTGPAHRAQPGQPGVNYAKVQQIVQENGYTDPEDIQAVIEDPDNEETYEERVEREEIERSNAMAEYRKKNKDKIVPISQDEWETDFPEIVFEREDLHYFTGDNVLTDDDGHHLSEYEYLGPKPRQFGWMNNDEDRIYIRNNPKERDYQVWKHQCESLDWWRE